MRYMSPFSPGSSQDQSSALESSLPQLKQTVSPSYKVWLYGATRIGWGLFQKIVIADRLAALVNTAFANPQAFSSKELLIAILFYSFQIYIDFAAYCDIALGAAGLFGIELSENFRQPYLATSIGEFWRRWHITLSSWLRDYIYIPLGGNRVSRARHYLNIMVTFLVSGLWHGANWTFVIWGGLHGIFQLFEIDGRQTRQIVDDRFGTRWWVQALRTLWTFTLASFAWVFFRAKTVTDALFTLRHVVTLKDWGRFRIEKLGLDKPDFHVALGLILAYVLFDLLRDRLDFDPSSWISQRRLLPRWGIYLFLILATMIFGYYGQAEPQVFIYAGF